LAWFPKSHVKHNIVESVSTSLKDSRLPIRQVE
jgi:hypothetical protein